MYVIINHVYIYIYSLIFSVFCSFGNLQKKRQVSFMLSSSTQTSVFTNDQYYSQRIHFGGTLLSCGSNSFDYQKWVWRHPKLEMNKHNHKTIDLESRRSSCLKTPFPSKQMKEAPYMGCSAESVTWCRSCASWFLEDALNTSKSNSNAKQ